MFIDKEHEVSYEEFIKKANVTNGDTERYSLFYLLALNPDTRNHIDDLYDFTDNCINFEGLNKGWQTSGSLSITRLAFNLYNGFTGEEIGDKCKVTPLDIFSKIYDGYWDYVIFGIELRLN